MRCKGGSAARRAGAPAPYYSQRPAGVAVVIQKAAPPWQSRAWATSRSESFRATGVDHPLSNCAAGTRGDLDGRRRRRTARHRARAYGVGWMVNSPVERSVMV